MVLNIEKYYPFLSDETDAKEFFKYEHEKKALLDHLNLTDLSEVVVITETISQPDEIWNLENEGYYEQDDYSPYMSLGILERNGDKFNCAYVQDACPLALLIAKDIAEYIKNNPKLEKRKKYV